MHAKVFVITSIVQLKLSFSPAGLEECACADLLVLRPCLLPCLLTCLATCLLASLLACLLAHPLACAPGCLPTWLCTCPPSCLLANLLYSCRLPGYLPTCLPGYLPTYILAYLPTCLLAYLPTCLFYFLADATYLPSSPIAAHRRYLTELARVKLVFMLLLFLNAAAGWCYDHEIKCTGGPRGRSVPIKAPMWRE